MDFFYTCLLIFTGLRSIPLSLSSAVEDVAVDTELLAPTPKIVQLMGRYLLLNICPVQNHQNYATVWSKIVPGDGASSLDISNGTELLIQNSRYSLVKDSVTSAVNLKIQDLQMTDSGLYQCTVVDPDGNRRYNRIDVEVFQRGQSKYFEI